MKAKCVFKELLTFKSPHDHGKKENFCFSLTIFLSSLAHSSLSFSLPRLSPFWTSVCWNGRVLWIRVWLASGTKRLSVLFQSEKARQMERKEEKNEKKRKSLRDRSRDEGKREGEIFRRNRSPSVRQSNHGPSQTSSIITIWLWYDGRVLTPSGRARLWRGGGGRPAGQGRAGCARAWTRGCGLVCFNRADVTVAGGLSAPLSCHSSGWVSRREPGLRLPDYRVVTIAVRLLTTWHPRTLHPFKCCFVSLRQIGELPSSKRRVRDGYKRKKTTNGEVLELHAVLALWWSNSCFSSLRDRTERREPTGTLYCSEVALSMLTKLYRFFLLI